MAVTLTMATDADIDPMLGANINAAFDDTMQDSIGAMAEANICALMRYDAVTNWATLDTNTKAVCTEYVARFIAIQGIAYDMSPFSSNIEAEDMIVVHFYRLKLLELLLSDQKLVTYLK